jgi:hypothetical protein
VLSKFLSFVTPKKPSWKSTKPSIWRGDRNNGIFLAHGVFFVTILLKTPERGATIFSVKTLQEELDGKNLKIKIFPRSQAK